MNEYFESPGFNPNFTFRDTDLLYGKKEIPYADISTFQMTNPPGLMTAGIVSCIANNKAIALAYKFSDRERMAHVFKEVSQLIELAHGVERNDIYRLQAHTGTSLVVYDTYILISFVQTGAWLSNVLNGGGNGKKRINIADISAIQFKEPAGVSVGFIQFSYPGSIDSKAGVTAAINDENSIPVSPQNVELARKIVNYLEKRRGELKNTSGSQPISSADEILKFKNLLDSGVITQEEFDAKKNQLLGM